MQNANRPGHVPFHDWTMAGPNAASPNHDPYLSQAQATECDNSAGGLRESDTTDAALSTSMGKVTK